MPALKITRQEAIDRTADVFRRYGYEGTSLQLISQATGLGRSSLYHHFPGGKEEIAREVFRHVGEQVNALILAPLRRDGTPQQRIKDMIRGVDTFYDGGGKNCLLGAMVLSAGPERFAKELEAAFRAWIDTLAGVSRQAGIPRAQAERRAESAVAQIQGALIVSRGLGQQRPFRRLLKALPTQLLAHD